MTTLSADQGWFKLTIEGGPEFGVYSLDGHEKLNEPFEFELELVSRDPGLDLIDLIGRQALLKIYDHGGAVRKVHGAIRQTRQLHTAGTFTHYKIWIVPRLWYLGKNQNHRIFQKKSVVDIIEQILKEQGFTHQAVAWKMKGRPAVREYCVQYGESDLYFISRLCEEEGIYFYFEHHDEYHTLCFVNAPGGENIADGLDGELRFFPGSGQRADRSVIRRFSVEHQVVSDVATYREWNFEQPGLNLEATLKEADGRKAPRPGGTKLETYQYPHLYREQGPGQQYADTQLKRQLTFSRRAEGEGDASCLTPGFAFTLYEHPRPDANAKWFLTEVHHHGEQPQVLEHEAPERGFRYNNTFTAIDYLHPFIPEIKHPKMPIDGLQSAIVTGPGGEEVYVDQYGRVKVHFHWDRLGPMTDASSLWVRVSDGWAGQDFGCVQIPRVGQEVLVEFMEGDPDRPVITGRVYNADHMPPWELPGQKPLSGLQSREFKGSGRNQLVMDDTTGEIQTQLSSDHYLSQLSLGRLTRIEHNKGRKKRELRGEGFELRTDGWGAVRAAKGLYISTDARPSAEAHHKDLSEALREIGKASDQHKGHAELAESHLARDGGDVKPLAEALKTQVADIRGGGSENTELAKPHLVFSSPAGLAVTTPESVHLQADKNTAFTAGRHVSVSAGRAFMLTAFEKISLFAYKMGIKAFAGAGKVEIQAQSDDMDIIADKVLKIISAKEKIEIAAAKEITLNAAGTFLKLNSAGIEGGTDAKFIVHAAEHEFVGPGGGGL